MQRTIASVFYRELITKRPFRPRVGKGGFLSTFVLPAAARDGFVSIVVPDMEQWYRFQSDAPVTPLADGCTGEEVAADLVLEWAGHVAGEAIGRPGIFVCRDLDEKDKDGSVIVAATKPSDRELATAREGQRRWCEWLCIQASDLDRLGKRGLVGIQHLEAAEWLGKSYPWMRPEEQMFMDNCPVCGAEIRQGVFKCPTCMEVFDEAGYEQWKKDRIESAATMKRLVAEAVAANPEVAGSEALAMATANPLTPKLPGRK